MKTQKTGANFNKMVVEAVQAGQSFFAWQSIGGVVEKCELKIKAYRKDYNEIELEARPDQEEALTKVISGNRMLNIYVPECSISFVSELKSVGTDKKIKIYPPKEYLFYERRKHERLEPSKQCFVTLELSKNIVKKTIYDISLGGFALILPKSEKIMIPKGKEFTQVVLDLVGRRIKAKLECTSTNSIDRFSIESLPYGGYKIAFRFTEMSKEDRQYLTEFVTHEILVRQQKELKKAN
ncbi:MAG: PilZ domain-containing protein [Bdellovibrionales bacterium]|nr:PilZ domain-containing protein [Bdellovibrionales bacterium]